MNYDIATQGEGRKKVLVIGCVHGDELLGRRVINELRKLPIKKSTLITVLANTQAIQKKKRFIDQDLNRSFPGDPKGNHEERLAYQLLPIIKEADFVLDIHSTTTDTSSTVILTKVNISIKKLLKLFGPKRVVLMEKKVAKTALTGQCRAGISFEYGKEKEERVYREVIIDIKKILDELGMIEFKSKKINKTEYFKVFEVLKREKGFVLKKNIKNFLLIKKGVVVAQKGRLAQSAQKNFYPVLFGPRSYKEIWGFMARKVNNL